MKIIDLLNKIANDEEVPEKVKFGGIIYEKAIDYNTKEVIDYLYVKGNQSLFEINDGFEYCFIKNYLDSEIEIIEEDNKKIEHIGKKYDITDFKCEYPKVAELVKDLNNKQYEIIDKLNEVLNDKD